MKNITVKFSATEVKSRKANHRTFRLGGTELNDAKVVDIHNGSILGCQAEDTATKGGLHWVTITTFSARQKGIKDEQ